jgi:hypothetical protein
VPNTDPADPVAEDLFGAGAGRETEEDPTRPWLAPDAGDARESNSGPGNAKDNHLRRRRTVYPGHKMKRDDVPGQPDERNLRPEIPRGLAQNHTLSPHWPAMTNPQLQQFCDMFAEGGNKKGFRGDWEEDTGTRRDCS